MSSLVFSPFPRCRSAFSEASLSPIFGPGAPTVASLAVRTKSIPADLTAFAPYLRHIYDSRAASFPSQWSHPCLPTQQTTSQRLETELCGTLWNCISATHLRIQSLSSLLEVRRLLEDCTACSKSFSAASSQIRHPFFTPALALFCDAYHRYLSASWQFLCASDSGRSPTELCQFAGACVQGAREADSAVDGLDRPALAYFKPLLRGILVYWQSLMHVWYAEGIRAAQGGDALAHLQAAAALFCPLPIVQPDQGIRAALVQLHARATGARDALQRSLTRAQLCGAPLGPSGFPPSATIPAIAATRELLIGVAAPPKPPPPRPPPRAGSAPPPVAAPVGLLERWDAVQVLKGRVKALYARLAVSADARVRGTAAQFAAHLKTAEESDGLVGALAESIRRGERAEASAEFEGAVAQSEGFYASLETRLLQLEARRL